MGAGSGGGGEPRADGWLEGVGDISPEALSVRHSADSRDLHMCLDLEEPPWEEPPNAESSSSVALLAVLLLALLLRGSRSERRLESCRVSSQLRSAVCRTSGAKAEAATLGFRQLRPLLATESWLPVTERASAGCGRCGRCCCSGRC